MLEEAGTRSGDSPKGALAAIVAVGTVLRAVNLGGRLSLDEAFTGEVARQRLSGLLATLRRYDAHPPLDYLLRAPIARHTSAGWVLRLPSFVFAVATLVAFALWNRRRGLVGLAATALVAVSPVLLQFGWWARMYAGLALVGVLIAVVAERWLTDPRPVLCWAVGALILLALFLDSSAAALAGGVMLVPGLRRDRAAWMWRLAVGAADGLWAITWGPTLVHQLGPGNGAYYIPFTTPGLFVRVVNDLVDNSAYIDWVVVAAVALGGVLIHRRDEKLGRIWVCCFALPVVAAGLVGTQRHFFLNKTLAGTAWAPMLALATVVVWAWEHDKGRGVAAAAIVAVIVLPSTASVLRHPYPSQAVDWAPSVAAVRAMVKPGDGIAADPPLVRFPAAWYLQPSDHRSPTFLPHSPLAVPVFLSGAGPWNGRVWLLESSADFGWVPPDDAGVPRCGPTQVVGGYTLSCLLEPASAGQ